MLPLLVLLVKNELKLIKLFRRQRQENAARAVERDRRHWETVQKTWHASTEADKAHLEMRHKVAPSMGFKVNGHGHRSTWVQ
jgi:hypothetical protein